MVGVAVTISSLQGLGVTVSRWVRFHGRLGSQIYLSGHPTGTSAESEAPGDGQG